MPGSACPVTYVATIAVPVAAADAVLGALEAAETPAAIAVTLFERGRDLIEISAHYAEEPGHDQLARLIGGAAAQEMLGALRIAPLADRDWVAHAEGLREPVRAGRFLVHGRHHRAKGGRGRYTLEIDAGLAFGTAQHASTRGCLLALDRVLKARRPTTVLDIGTGTGILAIAAAKALPPGPRRLLASDSDARAVMIAAANARNNAVTPRLRVLHARGLAHPHLRRFAPELVFANLTAPVLRRLAPELARHVTEGGIAVLAGIEQAEARGVEATYRAVGFTLKSRILLDAWTTLIMIRRKSKAVRD
jgi:ribosomal protein L11 methyltransferase